MNDLKQTRDEFEDYLGWKPLRWKSGCNGGTYYEPSIESRWQDFLQGWNRRTQSEATKPAQDLSAAMADQDQVPYLIVYDDVDQESEPVIGATRAAYRFGQISASWNAHLYVKIASNSRDCKYPNAALASPADALAEGDDDPIGDLQAEARQEKLDDFIASMNPNPATENKVQAVGDVLAERERQKQQEGWTPERDDKYIDCELARAAATYSLCTDPEQIKVCGAPVWPWPIYWWKPTTYRRNLVKAGALILAEIERLDRAAIQAQKDGHG